jgi:hypothetical protein
MTEEETPLLERVANYYQHLSTVAADLNAVSDELGKSIAIIDNALQRLNLGIATWVTIRSGEGVQEANDYSFWSRDIGYAKVGGKWGISLRTVAGDHQSPFDPSTEEWRFNDAPRSLRLEAIDKIPELLETLSKDAAKTTKDIRARLSQAQAVAEAVRGAAYRPAQIPLRTSANNSRPNIDLTQVSKPGDALKAILANKQIEQANAQDSPTATTSSNLSVESVRSAVSTALVGAGHESAAQMLGIGNWTLEETSIRIEVPGIGKKMLALTVSGAAEKIIRQELQRLSAPTRFLIVPGELVMRGSGPNSAPGAAVVAPKEGVE